MSALLGASLVAFSAFAAAGGRPQGAQVLQVRAKRVWTSAGQELENAVLVISDGRIRSVGTERAIDPRLPLIEHDGVLTAGLIAGQASSGARGELLDDARSVLPEARAVHAFDPAHRDFERALSAGITTLVLAPSGQNLVGGVTSAVKTAGGRVLAEEASLALSFSSAALGRSTAQTFFLFGRAEEELAQGELASEREGGPELPGSSQRGTREPTSYAGAIAWLDQLFSSDAEPFARARRGKLPVTLEAFDRHEIVRAARFAEKHGLAGAIRGAPLAGDPDVIAALRESGLGVIVGPYTSSQSRRSLESVQQLAAAGIPVAFALDAPERSPEELRVFAARAIWAGAARDTVWKALTSDAARLAGVGGAVGVLAPERDADLVFWSGDPLDLSSRVVAVFVDGKLAWSAPRAEEESPTPPR